ncbi:hypothetical protein HDE_11275 [Halotydeus destructor]|nr:hypothetical protein HDE_11275 [Halotydeus destructor]
MCSATSSMIKGLNDAISFLTDEKEQLANQLAAVKEELAAAKEKIAKLSRSKTKLKLKEKMADKVPAVDMKREPDNGQEIRRDFTNLTGYLAQNSYSPWVPGSPVVQSGQSSNQTASMPSATDQSTVSMESLIQDNVPQPKVQPAEVKKGRGQKSASPRKRKTPTKAAPVAIKKDKATKHD